MAYTYKKLTDVDLVDSAMTPNLLIEDSGDIKKISASNIVTLQTQSDWAETDPNSPAFILNKPESIGAGGGANVVTYTIMSSALMLEGVRVTAPSVINEWNKGSILRIDQSNTTNGSSSSLSDICHITYQTFSGSVSGTKVYYYSNGALTSLSVI